MNKRRKRAKRKVERNITNEFFVTLKSSRARSRWQHRALGEAEKHPDKVCVLGENDFASPTAKPVSKANRSDVDENNE